MDDELDCSSSSSSMPSPTLSVSDMMDVIEMQADLNYKDDCGMKVVVNCHQSADQAFEVVAELFPLAETSTTAEDVQLSEVVAEPLAQTSTTPVTMPAENTPAKLGKAAPCWTKCEVIATKSETKQIEKKAFCSFDYCRLLLIV